MRRITVTSNCQTAGIAAALTQILQGDDISPLPFQLNSTEVAQLSYAKNLARCDVWITIGSAGWIQKNAVLSGSRNLKILTIPRLVFSGFHPDIAYLMKPDGQGVYPGGQSGIGIWCWRNGIDVEDTVKFFTPQVFRDLGYFDRWYASKVALQTAFQATDLAGDFDRFFCNVQRQGTFMHTLNHPRPSALVQLARIVAVHLGADKSVLSQPVTIADGLDTFRWPVYPPIAEQLSLEGSYDFLVNEKTLSLKSYLEFSIKRDVASGLHSECVRFSPQFTDALRLDRVLGKQAAIQTPKL